MARKIILLIILLIQTLYVWYCMYNAQYLPYDDNYGLILHAFFVSLFVSVMLSIVWIWKRKWLRNSKFVLISWFILGSPVSVAIVTIFFYRNIFGTLQT